MRFILPVSLTLVLTITGCVSLPAMGRRFRRTTSTTPSNE